MTIETKVISLYSFKGGAGRTVCTANLAHFVAEELGANAKRQLLLADMDLDSAGLTLLLGQSTTFRNNECNSSKIFYGDFVLTMGENDSRLFSEGLVDISKKTNNDPGTVRFLGADMISREQGTETGGSAERMRDLISYCGDYDVAAIMIDSASGRQEVAQVCHQISDVIVYCCRLTRQFLLGTKWHLEALIAECLTLQGFAPKVVLYPVAVPDIGDRWRASYETAMSGLQILCRNDTAQVILVEPGLPEVQSFKWEETILSAKHKPDQDERSALESYASLAKTIVGLLNE